MTRRNHLLVALALGLATTTLLSLGLAAAGCTGGPPVATAADAARANQALAELAEGRAVLLRRCGGCHRAPVPADHRAGEWPVRLDEMSARSHLGPIERRQLEAYLVALAPR